MTSTPSQSGLILVLNAGSSSLKISLFSAPDAQDNAQQTLIYSALAERLGNPDALITIKYQDEKSVISLSASPDQSAHQQALTAFFEFLANTTVRLEDILVIGHRVVHGGEFFHQATPVTQDVITKIEQCNPLAPLHNPANLIGIRACLALLPQCPQVAVFDTAFHQSLDQEHYLYATPYEWYQQHHVRKYGFHGTSHQYVSQQAQQQLQLDPNNHHILIAHLGNGSSATAVSHGKSVDTTMGLTPLAGLMMGTRSGDIDPSIHHYISEQTELSLTDINDALNKKSGLLGVSGKSNDMRTLLEQSDQGHERSTLAIDLFCRQLAKQLMSLASALPRLDALVFTGGIGENSAIIRQKTIERLSILGFDIHHAANQQNALTFQQGHGPILSVICTDEELEIAQQALNKVNE